MKLQILKATITDFGWCPSSDPEKPTCAVLAIESNLTRKLAQRLGKSWLFEDNGVARHIDGSIGFARTFEGGSVELGDRSFPISRAWKFNVKQAKDDDDITLTLQCRLQFTEGHIELFAWALEKGNDTFGVLLAPETAQGELFGDDEDEEAQDAAAAETPEPATLAPMAVVCGNRGRRGRTEMVVRDEEGEVVLRGEVAEAHPAAEVQ